MVKAPKLHRADVPVDIESPLNYAVTRRDTGLLDIVQEALAHNQLLLAFQPVMRASNSTKVAYYEGLVRILDESGRVIPARDFVDVVENTEVGRAIDVQSLRLGLRALIDNPGLRLALNMSARSVGYLPWIDLLRSTMQGDETVGERLILEITEDSAMLVPELVIALMDELQPHGVCFALDNFGAGYTAIRYFKDFFFDILKIDGQFVRGIGSDPDNRAITAALLMIAHHFDMLTVAQNIETAEEMAIMTEMGVDCLQGYYFGAPSTQPDWLRNRRARTG